MRLFVAVWPSSEVRDVLADLRRPAHPAVRWTPLDRLHVTLHFLGDVADDAMIELGGTWRKLASGRAAGLVELGPSTAAAGRGATAAAGAAGATAAAGRVVSGGVGVGRSVSAGGQLSGAGPSDRRLDTLV